MHGNNFLQQVTALHQICIAILCFNMIDTISNAPEFFYLYVNNVFYLNYM